MEHFLFLFLFFTDTISTGGEKENATNIWQMVAWGGGGEEGVGSSCPFVGAQALAEDELPATPLGFPPDRVTPF